MKNIFIGLFSLVLVVLIYGCSSNSGTQVRVRNDRVDKVNLNVQVSGGNKFSINDVESGQTTEYQTITEGNITATAVIQNESISFLAEKNKHYTIIISANKPPSVQVDQ